MLNIQIEKTSSPKRRPGQDALGFGQYFTDHMFVMDYTLGVGWHSARIEPFHNLSLSPAAMVFHYAQEGFEGLKAYRAADGRILLFRPKENALRFARTNARMCIPQIPAEDFVQAVKALVALEADWVPAAPGASLYLRPFAIATEARLGVKPSSTYQFLIIASPSGAYYENGLAPVSIYVEDEYVRAAPGLTGFAKCGGNYAASLAGQQKAHENGCEQVLWLDGVHRRYVEEVGSMNCFFKISGVVHTAPCTGTVLPGITRMSCIELLREWGVPVDDTSRLAIGELMQAARSGALEEVFGTGTAAVVSPVGSLVYEEQRVQVADGGIGPLTRRLYDTLTGIQWGRLPDAHGWVCPVR